MKKALFVPDLVSISPCISRSFCCRKLAGYLSLELLDLEFNHSRFIFKSRENIEVTSLLSHELFAQMEKR